MVRKPDRRVFHEYTLDELAAEITATGVDGYVLGRGTTEDEAYDAAVSQDALPDDFDEVGFVAVHETHGPFRGSGPSFEDVYTGILLYDE